MLVLNFFKPKPQAGAPKPQTPILKMCRFTYFSICASIACAVLPAPFLLDTGASVCHATKPQTLLLELIYLLYHSASSVSFDIFIVEGEIVVQIVW